MTNQTPHQKIYHQHLSDAKNKKKASQATLLKELFEAQLKEFGLRDRFQPNDSAPKELRFHPDRQWRFDYACEVEKVAIEIQGGTYGNPIKCHQCHATVMRKKKDGGWFMVREGGRHQNATALRSEYEKLNEAQRLGWRVFLFNDKMVRDRTAIEYISRIVSPGPLQKKG